MTYCTPRAWPLSQLSINLGVIAAHTSHFRHEVRPGLDRLPVYRVLSASPLAALEPVDIFRRRVVAPPETPVYRNFTVW